MRDRSRSLGAPAQVAVEIAASENSCSVANAPFSFVLDTVPTFKKKGRVTVKSLVVASRKGRGQHALRRVPAGQPAPT